MSITTVTISSLADLIAKVTPPSPDPETGRHRDSGVYRGAGDASWPLLTSLDTLGGVSPPHSKADLEEHILRNFIRYSRPFFTVTPANDWEVLIAAPRGDFEYLLTRSGDLEQRAAVRLAGRRPGPGAQE